MATFNKFDTFKNDLGLEVHNLNTDVLKVYFTNATPSASGDSVKADLAEITPENGYPSGGTDIQNAWSGGVLTGTDVVWTASGGTFGPGRYVVLYNDTSASDSLIGWWDYGSSVTPADTETFTTDFGASILDIT